MPSFSPFLPAVIRWKISKCEGPGLLFCCESLAAIVQTVSFLGNFQSHFLYFHSGDIQRKLFLQMLAVYIDMPSIKYFDFQEVSGYIWENKVELSDKGHAASKPREENELVTRTAPFVPAKIDRCAARCSLDLPRSHVENKLLTSLIFQGKVKVGHLLRLVCWTVASLASQSRAPHPSTTKVGGWIFPQKLLKGSKQPVTALLYQINTLKKYYGRRVKVLSMNQVKATSLVSKNGAWKIIFMHTVSLVHS